MKITTLAALVAALLASCPSVRAADKGKSKDAEGKIQHGKALEKSGRELEIKGEDIKGTSPKEGAKTQKKGEELTKEGRRTKKKGEEQKKDARKK